MIANTAPARKNKFYLVKRARVIFSCHWNKTPLMSFGMTGVISTCTFHSCPEIRGCTGMYCTASETLTGRRPNFTTLAKPSPTGTVQTSSDGAFQLTNITRIPEAPALVEEGGHDGLQVHLVSV